MKIAIANDHSGVELKNQISEYIKEKYNYEIINLGSDTNEAVPYPLYGKKCAKAIVSKEADLGIAICGTGLGISLAANKVKGIRCCVCSEPLTASLSRRHNDANMLAFGARIVGLEMAKAIVDAFLTSSFEGGRHLERVDMIKKIEEENCN